MLHHISDEESDDPYDEFMIKEADEEEEAEKLMEIENELYSYVHYSSQNDFETETVDPKVWISLEKENSAVNRPLMRWNKNEDEKKDEDLVTKTYKCGNCSLVGHLSRDCRQMKQIVCYICGILGHISRNCPNRICFNCESLGHVARDCNEKRRLCDVYCVQCNMMGHKDYDCPDLWRRYHVTTKEGPIVKLPSRCNPRVYCYNCGVCGHFAHECNKPTMYKHVQPTYPFVISYKSNLKTKKKVQKRKSMKIIDGYGEIPVKRKIAEDEIKIVKNKTKKKRQNSNKRTH